MNDLLLQKIDELSLIKHNRDLLRLLGGLELEIRRSDGYPIKNSHSRKSRQPDELKLPDSHICTCVDGRTNCTYVNQSIVEQVQDTKTPQTYVCPSGFKKIVIPIVLNDEVIGLLFTGENTSFRFNGAQPSTIMDLLLQFTDYIVKNELNPLNLAIYGSNNTTRQKELLNRAVKCIKDNYHSNELTLKQVSEDAGVSYYYLSRIFKKELNTTFAQLRNKVRMEAAVKLLKHSRLSVNQISFTCGFDDPGYFCKVFKTCHGISPTTFRQKSASSGRIQSN